MRVLIFAIVALCTCPAILDAAGSGPWRGRTENGGSVSFRVRGGKVVGFRFVNACPADSARGTLVSARMVIRRGRFAHHDTQFTVKGRIGRRRAVGTARDVTGSCDSGVLRFTARRRQR